MLFSKLSSFFVKLESTSSRLEKIALLSEVINEGKDSIDKIIYLSEGRVVPFFDNKEFNLGKATIQKAISNSTGKDLDEVIKMYENTGDLGDVVYSLIENPNPNKYTVEDIFNALLEIANTTGKNSSFKKLEMLEYILKNADKESARYILRIILGKLRLGFSDRTILDALSVALFNDKSKRSVIEKAYYRCSDLGYIARKLVDEGIESLENIKLVPSIPVFAKLVERSSSIEETFKRIPNPLFQPKYDGLRAQIHLYEDEEGTRHVKIFSRRLEDLTEMFPDIVEKVLSMPFHSIIIDSEVIGFNPQTEEFFPFQETIQRKRKYNITELSERIPVVSFTFDILFLDGEDLTDMKLEERLKILKDVIDKSGNGIIKMSESILMDTLDEGQKYFLKCVEEGLEGIISKDLSTIYSPGTRNFEWIKLKRASVTELNDTIDCVILGYYYGYGQRSKFGIGALLVGVYNSEEDKFETIAKIGTGIKDEDFLSIKKKLDEIKINEIPSNVSIDKKIKPDVLVDPSVVVEVRADEITKSPMHTAGRNGEGIGYALRFPRLVKVREDKSPEEITSIFELKGIAK